jgi:sortase (surface protein transpeptidase)
MTTEAPAERVEVMRGAHRDQGSLFGPLPGLRLGDVVAYANQKKRGFDYRVLWIDVS